MTRRECDQWRVLKSRGELGLFQLAPAGKSVIGGQKFNQETKVSEWQPIATAPKDGSEILVCRAGAEDVFELIAWNAILRTWLDRNAEPYDGATHWLAIPPTPKH